MSVSKRSAGFLLVLALVAFGSSVLFVPAARHFGFGFDFDAFYCGARAARFGHDPYVVEPLHACEHAVFFSEPDSVTVPDPLPGFAVAVFVPLTFLAYHGAYWCWLAILAAAIAAFAWGLRRLTDCAPLAAGCCALLGGALVSLPYGQVVPLACAGIVLSALALRAGRRWIAAALLGLAMFVPLVGVAAALATAMLKRTMRLPVLLLFAALTAATLLLLGPAVTVEYVFRVLPAHSASELHTLEQFGLSELLAQIGLPPRFALLAGTLSSVVMFVLALVTAHNLRAAFDDDGFIVAVPATFVLIGGTFLHVHDFALALPALLLLRKYRSLGAGYDMVILLLCVPWQAISSTLIFLSPTAAVLAGGALYGFRRGSAAWALGGAAAVLLVVDAASPSYLAAFARNLSHRPPFLAPMYPNDLAQTLWTALKMQYGMIGESAGAEVTRLLSLAAAALAGYRLFQEGALVTNDEYRLPKSGNLDALSRT